MLATRIRRCARGGEQPLKNGRSVQAKAIAEQAKTAAAAAQSTADEAVKAATANAEVPPLRSGI